MKTRFEFTDVLNEYVKRENRSAGQLHSSTGIPKSSIENWLNGHVRHPQNWQDMVKLAKALNLSAAETDQLLRAAGHRTIEELSDVADGEDIKLLEQLSSTTARHQPNSVLHRDQVAGPKLTGDVTGDIVMGTQYKAGGAINIGSHVYHGSYPSSSQQSRGQSSSEWFQESDFPQPSSRQQTPLAETRVSLARQGATGDTFQQLDAIEREIKKGTRADIRELGQLLNQFEQDEVVDDNIYSQLLEEIQMGFPDASQSVLSSIRKRRERLYYDGR